MALPSDQYDDPAEIAARNEELAIGCAGCDHHRPTRDRSEYECKRFVDGYPNKTNKDCTQWQRRLGRRHPV